jgi:hypothetical protein
MDLEAYLGIFSVHAKKINIEGQLGIIQLGIIAQPSLRLRFHRVHTYEGRDSNSEDCSS